MNIERSNKVNEKARILLTGCGGYVGGSFLLRAINSGYKVRCVDTLIYGGKHLSGLVYHPNVEFLYGDLGLI